VPFLLSSFDDDRGQRSRQDKQREPVGVHRYGKARVCAASQNALHSKIFYPTSVKNQRFLPPSPQGEGYFSLRILTVGGFFDTLTEVKGADKTNNASLSAYIGTVRLAFVQ